MIFTYDDTLIRRYIPNVFDTVEGEKTLLEKLTPFLQSAEDWFNVNLFKLDFFNLQSDFEDVCNRFLYPIVINEAFRQAVPSLDLVLTDNGFGIISNQNTAPASKERVERLIASLLERRDNLIDTYLQYLESTTYWSFSAPREKFATTIFTALSIAEDAANKFETWKKLTFRCQAIENILADRFISPELYLLLRVQNVWDKPQEYRTVYFWLRKLELFAMKNNDNINVIEKEMYKVVDFIQKSNEYSLKTWKTTQTAKLFEDHSFHNDKNSGGFWIL